MKFKISEAKKRFISQQSFFCYLFTCTLFVFVSCANNKKISSNQQIGYGAITEYKPDFRYKKWFFTPPPGTVTGFSSTLGSPKTDAVVRLLSKMHITVKGFIREYYDATESEVQDSLFFYYDSIAAIDLKSKMIVLDSFKMNRSYAVLVSKDSLEVDTSTLLIHEYKTNIKTIDDTKNVIGKAAVPINYYNMHHAWVTAEENAIKNLSEKVAFYFITLEKVTDSGNHVEISDTYKSTFNLSVNGITVVERFYDTKKRTCNVIVACPKTGVQHMAGRE